MIRLLLRTLTGWGFGKAVSLVSPLQKFSVGLGLALWLGLFFAILGLSALWFYPSNWFAENFFDFVGGVIALISGLIAYAAFAVKNFQDQKVEALSDLGQKQFSKVLATAKSRLEKTQAIDQEDKNDVKEEEV